MVHRAAAARGLVAVVHCASECWNPEISMRAV